MCGDRGPTQWLGLAVLGALMAACGSGADEPSALAEPLATPTTTVTPSPDLRTPQPTSEPPIATATTPAPRDRVAVLAAGRRFDVTAPRPQPERPVILRLGRGTWSASDPPEIPPNGILLGATFSSPMTAWVWGWRDDGSFVVRSDDAGVTWSDPADYPAPPVGRLRDLIFQDNAGWAVGDGIVGGLSLARTTNEGERWNLISGDFAGLLAGKLGVRQGVVEVAYDVNGGSVAGIDPPSAVPEDPGPPGFVASAWSFETVGDRGWLGGSLDGRPAIYSALSGEEWTEQPTPSDGPGVVRAIKFRDDSSGIACGLQSHDTLFCAYTQDGGEEWTLGALPAGVAAGNRVDVAWGRGSEAFVVTVRGDPVESVLLHTPDGGRTWDHVRPALSAGVLIEALASTTEIPRE